MIEEKTMGITTTLKKTYPRKGKQPREAEVPIVQVARCQDQLINEAPCWG